MSYKVKVRKKTTKKILKSIPKPYYECPSCGYEDDIGGFCPNCEYVGNYEEMEYILPDEFEYLAEYLLTAAQEKN